MHRKSLEAAHQLQKTDDLPGGGPGGGGQCKEDQPQQTSLPQENQQERPPPTDSRTSLPSVEDRDESKPQERLTPPRKDDNGDRIKEPNSGEDSDGGGGGEGVSSEEDQSDDEDKDMLNHSDEFR